VKKGRVFVDKKLQLAWMNDGGAREIGALQPIEAKARGGEIAGQQALSSGRLLEAAYKGGARAHEIAEEFRKARQVHDE
jgi:hypothetical protein